MRPRKLPTMNQRKIARLEEEKKVQESRLIWERAERRRAIDSMRETIAVKDRQTLLGARPERPVTQVAIMPGGYGARSFIDHQMFAMYGPRSTRIATFEWKKFTQEIPTGDPGNEPVYVVWFVPEFKGVR